MLTGEAWRTRKSSGWVEPLLKKGKRKDPKPIGPKPPKRKSGELLSKDGGKKTQNPREFE